MFNNKVHEETYKRLRKVDKTITRAKMIDLADRLSFYKPRYMVGSNPKVEKGIGAGWLTGIMMLAPSDQSGFNVCPKASKECSKLCLGLTSGRGVFDNIQKARISRTRFLLNNKSAAESMIEKDIKRLANQAMVKGQMLAIRLNGTSDLPALAFKFARKFPEIQFYDYTAIINTLRRDDIPANYHLTFSRKEDNQTECIEAIERGYNVSAVWSDHLPETFLGQKVFDADKTDLRFTDPNGIAGLIVKGIKGKQTESQFVIDNSGVQ